MATVRSLVVAAHKHGDAESLRALAIALSRQLVDVPDLPTDPAELWAEVEEHGLEAAGSWREVRACRDHGELTEAEYDYLSVAVEALTFEKETTDV